jgi:hypothetical protein
MSATVEIGSSVLQRDSAFHRSFSNINAYPTSTKEHLYVPAGDGVYAFKNDGSGLVISSNPVLSNDLSDYGVAAYRLSNNTEIVAGVKDSILSIYRIPLTSGPITSYSIIIDKRFSTSPSIAVLDSLCILVGSESGSFYIYSIDGRLISKRSVTNDAVTSIAFLPVSQNSYEYFFTAGNRIYSEQDSVDLPVSSNGWILAAAVSAEKGNFIVALEKNGGRIISYNQSLSSKNFEIRIGSSAIQETAIADIDGDGGKILLFKQQLISRF